MNNGIQKFVNEQFGEIRTVIIDNEPWFVAKDVCDILGIVNPTDALSKGLEPFERTRFNLGRQGETNIINESGFYTLVLRSRKPIAKPFRLWVTREVLPQIRQTGGYIEADREAEFVDKYFPSFTEETKLSMVQDLRKQNEEYRKQIADLEPKAQAYSDLMTAQGYLQFIDVAALVEIGRNTLFQFLRKCKVLTKQSNYNIPYGRFTKNGMFKVVTSRSENGHISSVTMVSPKGLNYIYKLMKKKDVLDEFNTTTLLQKIKDLEVA